MKNPRFFASLRMTGGKEQIVRMTEGKKWTVAMEQYYIYIMTNKSKTLYTGMTNNLERRVYEHKNKLIKGFTKKYNIIRLVYYEVSKSVEVAIAREKQIKGWLRRKKIDLIESVNPQWNDLSEGWFSDVTMSPGRDAKEKSFR
jgi:putative endonuclease